MKQARRFLVHGKLRKVGYRSFAKTCAEALGLAGWVRHTAEGAVEAHAEGNEQQLSEFAFDLSRGSRYARVERVEQAPCGAEGLSGFQIRR
ncbi:MAG: acylphosphatase [Acidobacteriota bacterium]|nr:MAG: acylphosphatase [Acidobacteriota bacterium]